MVPYLLLKDQAREMMIKYPLGSLCRSVFSPLSYNQASFHFRKLSLPFQCRYSQLNQQKSDQNELLMTTNQRTESDIKRWRNLKYKVIQKFEQNESENFELVRFSDTYIDRSNLCNEIFGNQKFSFAITSPRRTGKSTNLSMLKNFCEIQVKKNGKLDEDKQKLVKSYFLGSQDKNKGEIELPPLEVATHLQSNSLLESFFGKYPVLFLNFKDIRGSTIQEIESQFQASIQNEFTQLDYLCKGMDKYDQKKFEKFEQQPILSHHFSQALHFLCRELSIYHKKRVIIMIDEVDSPINTLIDQEDINYSLIHKVTQLVTNIVSTFAKSNSYVEKLITTGVFDAFTKEGNSPLNNLRKIGVFSGKFGAYYGIQEERVRAILDRVIEFQDSDKEDSASFVMRILKGQFNGFVTGNSSIFNLWSISKYFEIVSENNTLFLPEEIQTLWEVTGSNRVVNTLLQKDIHSSIKEKFLLLEKGEVVSLNYNENQVRLYEKVLPAPEYQESFYSYLLLNGGYIVLAEDKKRFKIPNKEISGIFKRAKMNFFSSFPENDFLPFTTALNSKKEKDIQDTLNKILQSNFSFLDLNQRAQENQYQICMNLPLFFMRKTHYVYFQQEAGEGKADFILVSRNNEHCSFILELKVVQTKGEPFDNKFQCKIQNKITEAMKQMKDKKYSLFLNQFNPKEIGYIALVFNNKSVQVKVEVNRIVL